MKRFNEQLRITEIFHSLQGESVTVGLPTVFVRLTGCPLRCQYCDTAYAFSGGEVVEIDDILNKVASYQCQHVCVTGGEPLAQPGCILLLSKLCDAGYSVSLETSGARDIASVDQRVMIVMDLKTPDSREADKNLLSNLSFLK
ncbi:TPA: radical SAM protein, partial [Legionella pneumophila]|nr:radical SAM protein [Legionella pneumophila]